jgi:uncharacterized protein (DUF433 family)
VTSTRKSTTAGDGSGAPDVLNAPLYALADVARLLHVHVDTLRYWVRGGTYALESGEVRRAEPIVGDGTPRLSFQDLAELSVVAHLWHLGFSLPHLREVARQIMATTATPRPFLEHLLAGGGKEIAIEVELGRPLSMSSPGQRVLPLPVEAIFRRVVADRGGTIIAVRPFSRPDQPFEDPEVIEIDPRRRFGRPVTRPHGLDVAAIHDRYMWGETIEQLMEDLGAGQEEIQEAIRYHGRYLHAA